MKPREGVALLIALFALLLVEAMTVGMLALATHSRMVAAADMRTQRAQAAADLAAASVFNQWRAGSFDTLRPGVVLAVPASAGASGDLSYSATIERAEGALYLVRASARAGGSLDYSVARSVTWGRTLDRDALINEFNEALESAGLVVLAGGTRVSAGTATLPPAWSDSLCPMSLVVASPAALISAVPPIFSEDVELAGDVVVDSAAARSDSLPLPGVTWRQLESIADRLESGVIQPGPFVQDTACLYAAPGNWGDPLRPDSPCGRYSPLVLSNGDLVVAGGSGQGILAVRGTLTLGAGSTFVGLIVAGNGITMEPGAQAYGAVHSRQGLVLLDGATLTYSRCAVSHVLGASSAARRVLWSPRRFIPAF